MFFIHLQPASINIEMKVVVSFPIIFCEGLCGLLLNQPASFKKSWTEIPSIFANSVNFRTSRGFLR